MAGLEKDFELLGGMGEEADGATEAFAGARSTLHQRLFELAALAAAPDAAAAAAAAAPEAAAAALRAAVTAEVRRSAMGPLYEAACCSAAAQRAGWPAGSVDEALRASLRAENAAELAKLDAAIVAAREGPHGGEVEAAEAMTKRADYLAKIGDSDAALAAYAAIPEKPLSTGQKADIAMSCTRLAFWAGDWPAMKAGLAKAKALNDAGGDWDRRNRLKVYEGCYCLAQRDFAGAAALLLDSIATFTATELLDYTGFAFYTSLACLKALDRSTLKKRVIDSPDIIAVVGDVRHLEQLLGSFHECRYREFFAALVGLQPAVKRDRLLARHAAFFLREMRLAAYAQFLASYRAVTLAGMAAAFGVSAAFLDAELARFIAAGRLPAKIDAVNGAVETTRPDSKNAQYHALLKSGDLLLNKVQKLGRVTAL